MPYLAFAVSLLASARSTADLIASPRRSLASIFPPGLDLGEDLITAEINRLAAGVREITRVRGMHPKRALVGRHCQGDASDSARGCQEKYAQPIR